MNKKFLIIGVVAIALIAFIVWLFIESSKPLSGTKITDLGRKHVPGGEKVDYNSNPPTSGAHDENWIRSGVYSLPQDDKKLVHSLEHGYVIMSYNCGYKGKSGQGELIREVYAHGIEEASSSAEATSSGTLSAIFKSAECHKLVDQLIAIYEKRGKIRLIVVPRPNLDSKIALTAWDYLDKFDSSTGSGLTVSEIDRIEKFIDTHLNQGPEKTME